MEHLNIKEIREDLGLTKAELSRILNVCWVTVHAWEQNKNRPSPVNQERINTLIKMMPKNNHENRDKR